MKLFNAIIGVFAIFAAIYTWCYPGVSFLTYGWIVTITLCMWGVCALFEVLSKKSTDTDGKLTAGSAALALLGGIAAAVLSLLFFLRPGLSLALDVIVIWIFTFWLIVSGISSILSAVTVVKPLGGSGWILTLILGSLTLLGGLYGIFHIVVMAQTIGLLLGVMLMVYGIRLLASVLENI